MIAIIGAGGHGKCAYDCFNQSGVEVYGFFDDEPGLYDIEVINGLKCLGNSADVGKHEMISSVFIAIGDNRVRLAKYEYFKDKGYRTPSTVHQKAHVSDFAYMGEGIFVMGAAIINPHARIGDYCIINTSATVGHDSILGRAVQVGPGVNIAGGCRIGEGAFIGIGAKIAPKINIGAWSVVGSGSVVLRDLPDHTFCCGIPSKIFNEPEQAEIGE